ncbi:MAG: acetyl-CoA C-acetyltransferase [Planctomycetota bacterium]|nr:acetyl-CoA C-acetyltransferase [Planctomycetota bacterium]
MPIPVILSAARLPIGKFLGGLSSFSAPELGALAFKAALARAGVKPEELDEAILGNVLSAGLGQAVARQAALKAGCPESLPAFAVNKVCGSGLKAVMLAAQAIRAGDAKVVLAGGAESMSNAPHLVRRHRTGSPYGHGIFEDSILSDGLECAFEKWHMGSAAEHIARRFKVSREEMDNFALQSHQRAVAAQEAGHFKKELVPAEVPQRKGPALVVDKDEGPRADTALEKLAKLPPAFEKDGCVTAGNSSSLNDGAAALVVADEAWAKAQGKAPLARILAYATAGVAPKEIFHAPSLAVPAALAKADRKLGDVDLFELNEAFAAQSVANVKHLEVDPAKVNVHGGAVALGHPIGASGARVLVTLLHALEARGGKLGVASLCLGGGNAVALVVERP